MATDKEIDSLVEMIAQKVQSRLQAAGVSGFAPTPAYRSGPSKLALAPKDRGPCHDDNASDEDCSNCGACVVRRPWSVRALEEAGASRIAASAGIGGMDTGLAKMIDHTLLKPDATREEVTKLCDEARKHHFASVCVNTTWVPLCKRLLAGSGVMVCCVVGFPLGAMTPTAKAYEAKEAVRQGAQEVDMVINIGALKSRDYETVFEDICRVVKASGNAAVKVILETSSLTEEEKIIGCSLSKMAGAAFVKTSTGFAKGGATEEDIKLMRRIVGSDMGVKASGGVRTFEDAEKMRLAGANRIGASASVSIVAGPSKGKAAAQSGY